MSYFSDLGLAEPILRALETKGYTDPTPIQRQSIPALLEGRDLLGIAQTGTGKTAAFALPSLHRLAADPQPRKPASCRMLVLSPTRELAAQIADNMKGYAKNLRLTVDCVFGGIPIGKQARRLVPGVDILVATPGRLLDLIDNRALTIGRTEIFVLDEADQMMDLGFIHALKRVANLLPAKRQSLFFSATMPKSIEDLGKQFIKNPVRVEVAPQSTTAERVEQFVSFLNQPEKQALLSLTIRRLLAEKQLDRGIVFTRTKHGADRVARNLSAAGIDARAIHGNKSQAQRTAALEAFRQGSCPVLVATDIAARGIDVSGVSHVFNFELPNVPEQYVHRIGRTARAGADGVAISFCAPDEKPYLRDIERLTKVKPDVMPLPENFLADAARLPAPVRRAAEDTDMRRDQPRGRAGGGRRDGGRSDGRRDGGSRHDAPRADNRGEPRRDDTRRSDAPRSDTPRSADRTGQDRRRSDAPRSDAARHDAGGEAAAKRRFRPRGPATTGQHRNKVRRVV
ncbi:MULTISPECIES: DEAD/DEAH box helicase [unclassified Novosphingobium]|uniref:DEAD/DEAH box helicase n=1 Tax=unclassified Novosphingobium TaxID=2644732 RepID=UPI00144107DB|nr:MULTISPECIES: DEAD/DEAH box helicase [unclassified Novosphingobium]MBB3359283.1 ATP-dependent RNA helicase RhlE [Novosphingobium sp. BK256]MBB3375236.1 ATP-dependent RNA helicase RhlE [Novosphingobium sp. BK280]MBB3380056.1 ATP-dependent RNA helicase RhlE [Novosphingobium sp. BK258]MBB3421750.1 ATP-dependent RNA helicase RhlE [Novosphingobium sp. BK267]MBB3450065.1 ATP-dependent RNA helicase RhlE [Novosphingobium sp. BK352]